MSPSLSDLQKPATYRAAAKQRPQSLCMSFVLTFCRYAGKEGSSKEQVRVGEAVCLTSYLQLAEVCADTPPLAGKTREKR